MEQSDREALMDWYDRSRRDLPWRRTKDPYRVWLSEVMLQQTRVETVKGYYARFLQLFPDARALADAPEERVLKAWEGLGYYSRARNLHAAAKVVANELGGRFPDTYEGLLKLPGVGDYTAGAVASIAFGRRVPAVDGNVYRVLTRYHGVREDIGRPDVRRRVRALAADALPPDRPGDLNQALMELGATLCAPAAPDCGGCPLRAHCDALAGGDADALPLREPKRPPTRVDVAVCLVQYGNELLVTRRAQRMLGGMYVFPLAEGESEPAQALERLQEMGLRCAYRRELGTARHVFTHRVWDMRVLLFTLLRAPDGETLARLGARFADAAALSALPMPAAMRAARALALDLLSPNNA